MTPEFKKAFNYVKYWEGGYSDHPEDKGGKTRFGITEKVARDQGYSGHMKDFPLNLARNIYYSEYWLKVRGNDLWEVDKILAAMVFDFAVNAGVYRSSLILQSTLNSKLKLTEGQLIEDGIIGSKTIKTIQDFMKQPSFNFLFITERCGFYCFKNNPSFIKGWIRRATGFLFLKELGIDI